MPSVDSLDFEMQRRVILYKSGTVMPDDSLLGYNGDPNNATTNNAGESLLYNSAVGTLYVNDSGVMYRKTDTNNTWENIGSGSGSISAGELTDFNFDGNAIEGFDATIVNSTSTTYTLSSSDAGKLIAIEHASTITITIPTGLDTGFNCSFLQKGSGSLEFSASNGVTLSNRQSYTKTAGQYAMATLVSYDTNKFVLTGDLF
ncbi:MAG: hypothetical protein CL833_02820 [Crocinitomicaceae bacterium]|nr:hypothetical protein [Crocinitomicaceae bacterium]|tara:strand:+ start:1369 stop:1974 length:606 start_codon:yes stop_codon:yes gene_type:complete